MVYHAAARGIQIEELESTLEGDLDLRGFMGIAPDVRKGYQNIRVNFTVKSDASAEQLRELAQFSPVFDTIRNPVAVTLQINPKQGVAPNSPAAARRWHGGRVSCPQGFHCNRDNSGSSKQVP